ncbi:LysR family transcriptional regulator [Azospirillum soli]|uniref:LysR family transcriptional regulator n=1 Tax=Azospirillum soli TaxID=1304799 RepID=UPI001AEB97D7|nr:LysR family transcriptional regulator [Azospirillum soli]MBP2315353.1 DNA-binding transcriptional LysR family regulator [Azospirillum soli]
MNREIPNLRHLRAFHAVAQSQSISAASRQVFISQPAITQAIAKMEKTLGVTLFDRRPDGVFLTEPGRLFHDRVERMLRYLQSGVGEVLRSAGRRGARPAQNLDQMLTGVQLRALIAIADARNFSLAARSVGISQPALHRAARELEHLADVPLFEKVSRGIALTRPADVLVMQAKLALVEYDMGLEELADWKTADSGRLVIGAMPLARTFLLPTAINALLRERPEARVEVVDGPYEDLLHGLRQGDLDLLVGALRNPVPIDDVVQESLFNDPLAVVARVGHPLSQRGQIGIADIARCDWVVPRRGTPTRAHFEQLFADAGVALPRSLIETGAINLIRGLLTASDRLTLISLHQIRHEMQWGLLAPLPFKLPHTARPIGLTVRRDWRPTAAQARFISLLKEAGRVIHAA